MPNNTAPWPSTFASACYSRLREVPPGKITTYRDLAAAMNSRATRAVGSAMRRNPYAPEVPCHRVVCSDGRIGQYAWGVAKKIALLRNEGVEVIDGRVVGFEDLLHRFG